MAERLLCPIDDMHDYQDVASDFQVANEACAVWLDAGLGKTGITLNSLIRLRTLGLSKRVLVIAPLKVAVRQWPGEMQVWRHTRGIPHTLIRAEQDHPEAVAEYRAVLAEKRSHGWRDWALYCAQRARTAKMEEIRQRLAREDTFIHIINVERVAWLVAFWGKKNWPYDTVVIDEASNFNHRTSDRFKSLVSVRAKINRVYELTASPAAETYMSLFTQIFLLDRGKRFGRYITHFRSKYFDYNEKKMQYKLKKGADKQIADSVADVVLTMRAKDYLKRDEALIVPRYVDLTEHESDIYQKFRETFFLEHPLGDIEAPTAGALAQKILQFASGAVYDNKGETRFFHDHKLRELEEIYAECVGSPLLVGYWFKSSLARLKKAFPKAVVMSSDGREEKAWNDGKIGMMLVHPQSAGHGLNLQYGPGHRLALYDMFYRFELWDQLIKRLDRQGQKELVIVNPILARRTEDIGVFRKLAAKEDAENWLKERVRAIRAAALKGERLAA